MLDSTEEYDDPSAYPIGDVRQSLDCEYVVDLLPTENGALVCAGNTRFVIDLFGGTPFFFPPF
jgi:hypothetical protein